MSFITRNVEEELFEDRVSMKDENLTLRKRITELEIELAEANKLIETRISSLENRLDLLTSRS